MSSTCVIIALLPAISESLIFTFIKPALYWGLRFILWPSEENRGRGVWEWRLLKFPLSAYCCIPGHADLVHINQPKALVASEVYHTVKYDGWRRGKELAREGEIWMKNWMFPIHGIFVVSYNENGHTTML
jgi:hypothetical protein